MGFYYILRKYILLCFGLRYFIWASCKILRKNFSNFEIEALIRREKIPMSENELVYNERYCDYRLLYEGLEFCWDEKPSGDYLDTVKVLAKNYHKNIDKIAAFMLEDIQEMYDESITIDDVKERIGIPQIDPELGTVTYCEQTFDHTHIFCFEFWDDEFEDLNYFAIDG